MSKTFYLPRVTARQIEKQLATCQNLGLILDKYPETQVPGNSQAKSTWLREIHPDQHMDSKLAQSAYNRWLRMTQAVGATLFSGTTDWRMVVGLGGETILETDLTLHHLYGIPFVPGSALKGLTRSYVTTEVKEYQSNKIDDDNADIKRIFGSQEYAGTVIFFDAMPVNGETNIELDIMNPHYPDYYGKGQAPTNDQNPSPITFLTVANTTFMFALAPRRPKKDQDDVERVKTWLQEALKSYGVGGKTSAGYGYFKEVQDVQAVSQTNVPSSKAVPIPPSVPTERIRPNIPTFREGQDIKGLVVTPTDELRQMASADTKAFLRYESFATRDVLMVVNAEEAQNWKPGETRICQFMREDVRDRCTVLVCQPRPSKKKR
jgi:CRISPR-associated protein Cmr6